MKQNPLLILVRQKILRISYSVRNRTRLQSSSAFNIFGTVFPTAADHLMDPRSMWHWNRLVTAAGRNGLVTHKRGYARGHVERRHDDLNLRVSLITRPRAAHCRF